MITITEKMIQDARKLIAHGTPEAVGYRLMVYTIDAVAEMESAEMEKFPELAKRGVVMKTDDQTERESKGSHYGILISKGDQAFKAKELGEVDWVEEGDLLIFDRYAGVSVELPPGSGQKFRFANDECVVGRMRNEI